MELNIKQENAIRDFLNEATDYNILDIVREINNYDGQLGDLTWYPMDEFDELMSGAKPWDIARATFYGDFNPTHNYWRWDAYGNFESIAWFKYDFKYDSDDYETIINALYAIPWEDFPDDIKELLEDIESENEDEK